MKRQDGAGCYTEAKLDLLPPAIGTGRQSEHLERRSDCLVPGHTSVGPWNTKASY